MEGFFFGGYGSEKPKPGGFVPVAISSFNLFSEIVHRGENKVVPPGRRGFNCIDDINSPSIKWP
jgi:hypothetical protein